jgi:flagellar hook-associated protein 3 FlgL
MSVRVTGQSQVANAIAYLRQQSAGLAKYNDQISSGNRINVPSDDPTQYPSLLRAKADSGRFAAYAQTMSDATSSLNAGVNALQEVNATLVRAKTIALEGANATSTPDTYEALAIEVDGLIDRALKAGNTQLDGKYLFGGTQTGTAPFRVASTDSAGRPAAVAYDGSADRTRAVIGPGQTADTRYSGDQVLQQTGGDVFAALIGLRDDLRNPSPAGGKSAAINQRLVQLDAARNAVSDTTAEQSSSLATLDALKNRMTDLKLTADQRSGEIEGTDYAEAVVKMQQFTNGLQATMAVSARILQPSLLDFIR